MFSTGEGVDQHSIFQFVREMLYDEGHQSVCVLLQEIYQLRTRNKRNKSGRMMKKSKVLQSDGTTKGSLSNPHLTPPTSEPRALVPLCAVGWWF